MRRVLPYIITFIVGAAIFVAVICGMGIWNAATTQVTLQILCDAFFTAGAVIFGVGLLVFCSNGGAYYMLSYAIVKLVDLFRRGAKGKYKDFYEYAEKKKEKQHSFGFMLIVGLVFLAAAVGCLIGYNNC